MLQFVKAKPIKEESMKFMMKKSAQTIQIL